jgi:DNA primase
MDLKEDIKNSIKLSDLIKKNIALKQRDKSNFIGLCPFHKEKTPSFNISDDKGFYHLCNGNGKYKFLRSLKKASRTSWD